MYSDFHLHTRFSADSNEDPESTIQKAISLGMKEICFTDHNDFDWPVPDESFNLDVPSYMEYMSRIKGHYEASISVRTGIECGITPANFKQNNDLISTNAFDFVIGSCHIVDGMDPYYPEFFKNRTDFEALSLYFNEIKASLQSFNNFDVLGHMDYVIRYSPNGDRKYSLSDYTDVTDYILKTIISLGKGIEINTSGLKSGLEYANPSLQILKRYKELGGEIITIGSDAHKSDYVGYKFEQAGDFLKTAGFSHYCVFKNRKPEFKPL